jgi:uncharacterized membrane protein YfcA
MIFGLEYGIFLLYVILVAFFIYFLIFFLSSLWKKRNEFKVKRFVPAFFMSIVANFFDALGIGSFATTTAMFSFAKYIKNDQKLPGTLNIGHNIPVFVEALLFIAVVKVDPVTLLSLVISATIGSALGARFFTTKLPEKKIQMAMGLALLITAILMVAKLLGFFDFLGSQNTGTALSGISLVIAVVLSFVYGALMTLGVGFYAPCMATVYLLGLQPIVAFPIIMASSSALMSTSSVEFLKKEKYSFNGVVGLAAGGIIGVSVGVHFVSSLNMTVLGWLIVCVVIYTGILYTIKSLKSRRS